MSQAVGLAKVTLEQAGESLAVASFVASHLVHGVVDGIETSGLGTLGKIGLAGGGAVLGLNAHLQVAKRLCRSAPGQYKRRKYSLL